MKRIVILAMLMCGSLFSNTILAQVPSKMSYQAVIRNSSNELIINAAVGLRLSILKASPTGQMVYQQTMNPMSNSSGIVSVEFGGGPGFDTINWASGPYFIKTESDPTGGTNYTISGTTQLLSVPFAFHAKTAENLTFTAPESDSIVLKDTLLKRRIVLNPNMGAIKLLNNDTVWYEMSVKSPRTTNELLPDGRVIIERAIAEGAWSGKSTSVIDPQKNVVSENKSLSYSASGVIHTLNEDKYYRQDPVSGIFRLSEIKEVYRENNTSSPQLTTNYTREKHDVCDNSGLVVSRTIVEQTNQVSNNAEILDQRKETKQLILPGGGPLTQLITTTKKEFDNATGILKETTIKEVFENDKLRERTTIVRPDKGINTRKIEYFDQAGQKVSESFQQIDNQTPKIINQIQQGEQGTKVVQTKNEVVFSPVLGSSAVSITHQPATGQFDVSAYIGNNQKQLMRVTGDYGYLFLGPSDNMELLDGQNILSGMTNFTGAVNFQGNTTHNGAMNLFQGSINAKDAFFNGDVQVGTSSQPKNVLISGNATVNGSLAVNGGMNLGTSTVEVNKLKANADISVRGPKKFVIPHPTDNTKLLQHAAVESNQVYNIYVGKVQTNADGLATVTLPTYFPNINQNMLIFYQLTVHGANFTQAVVFNEYSSSTNSFVIKTSAPFTMVSWQVMSKRNDAYMIANPFTDVISAP